MLAITRQSQIKDIVLEKKSVTVTELSQRFSVTEETIRRDLKILESEGFLTRTYGGAFIQNGVNNSVDLSIRETTYLQSKQSIASSCLKLIHNGDSIFLDSSTTCLYIAKAIKEMRLTVVTNSLLIVNELCDNNNIHLVCIGGNYTPSDKAFNGFITQLNLETLFFDKSFISCRSLSIVNGITDSLEQMAKVRQAIINRSEEVYVVADFSKFDKTSFIHIANFDKISGIVTDRKLNDNWVDFLKSNNVAIYESQSYQPENKSWNS
ncbi:DeoR/GlpR family DNA-binding transcription regulator [Clostridium sp. AL.422]|uniref:DeoR/GlpR family DNA-binding transcription regulator n=1 Tax=Clostridium TaxID=1485 RepID=UPI00293DAD38|nr:MULTISPECIES: DeoR/GlpR family DNA-binding transcription regulator [unclassified Clostridium]MDV4149944.1 DeoR/GlpR family DNA-binding transcription regulator [Clostridium sp. AL.422]